ncbi:hypothetical protein HN388_05775 [bacterium]|jgi:hypothetical protein|nr:hypothetical protein [bacterium]MBT7310596.1 hypothetical protein [bacterium]
MRKHLLVATLILAIATTATAGPLAFGPRAGFSFNPDQFFVGGHANLPDMIPIVKLKPSVEVGFGDNLKLFAFNLEATYDLQDLVIEGFQGYVGGGPSINIWKWDFDGPVPAGQDDTETEFGLSALIGASRNIGLTQTAFFEIKLGITDETPDMKLVAGLTFF